MESSHLILFICLAAPLSMMLFIFRERARTLLAFLLIGIFMCFFAGEINGLILNSTELDMRFLTDSDSKRGGTILNSVVQMTKELNMPVIAEGVETREQAEYLSSMGCYRIQGYYYSRPVPENDFIELMKKEK